jgi:peptidyl-prolyl cis-trans isomerase B (cyclophilin B)
MQTRHVVRAIAMVPAIAWLGCGVVDATPGPGPDGDAVAVIEEAGSAERDPASPAPRDVAVLQIRGLGTIRFELLPESAPIAVTHFSQLAQEGFYAGTTFHRVIPGFMMQGGDPNSRDADPRNDGKGGGTGVPVEFSDVPQIRGIVSLAHRGNPNTAGSQFFILHADAPHLDGNYSVFGRVIEGLEVIDAITEVEIDTYGRYGPESRPYPVDVVIESVRIEPADRSTL